MKTGIIYIIRNKINDKVYIGQTTTNLKTRFNQHCKKSTLKNRHYKLYNAIKKYGRDNFYIGVIEDNIKIEELDQKEIYYIEKFNSYYNGYNSTKGGDGRVINKKYDEKQIVELYKKGFSSKKIGDVYNVSYATISRVLNKLNVETRHDGNKYEKFDVDCFVKMWRDKNTKIKDMAKFYGVNEKTIRRHAKRLQLNRKGVSTIERYNQVE